MCEYCKKEKPLFKSSEPRPLLQLRGHEVPIDNLEVGIFNNILFCQADGYGTRTISINFCPLCGEELNKKKQTEASRLLDALGPDF